MKQDQPTAFFHTQPQETTMTPTAQAKLWALTTLQDQLVYEQRFDHENSVALQRAKARLVERMLRKLEDQKVLIDGNVQPMPIGELLT